MSMNTVIEALRPIVPPPSKNDWEVRADDIDAVWAKEQFFALDTVSAIEQFDRNVVSAAESIEHMPAVPFRYFLWSLGLYMLGLEDGADNAADVASNFLQIVEHNLTSSPKRIVPLFPRILELVDYAVAMQERFDIPADIYGDFTESRQRIEVASKLV